MEDFITKTFQTSVILKAKATMAEFDENPQENMSQLFNICVHLEACFLLSDLNYIDEADEVYTMAEGHGQEGLLRPQYEVIEGMPRSTAWMVQRSLAALGGIECPKYLADMYDYKRKRFLEVGVTKGLAEDYFQRKKTKLGGSMEIAIFSYEQHHSISTEGLIDSDGLGRVLSRLTELQAELSGKNLWHALSGEEEGERTVNFRLSMTYLELRENSLPQNFRTFDELRTYIDNMDTKGSIERGLARMSPNVSITPKKITWGDIVPVGIHTRNPDLKPVPYTAFLLMADGMPMKNISDGSSKRPKDLMKGCLNQHQMLRDCTNPITVIKSDKADENLLWKLYRDGINCIMSEGPALEVPKSLQTKWATGEGLTFSKIPFAEAKGEEDMIQEDFPGPEPRRPSPWVQTEYNLLCSVVPYRALDLPEIGPDVAPIEHVGTRRRNYFTGEVTQCKAASVMMKYVLFNTALMNECCADMSKHKVIPIHTRTTTIKGENFDNMYGFAVKGKSHLRADTDVVSVVTFEFSLTDPRVLREKWEKYTVFNLGRIFVSTASGLKGRDVFLYCRVNGTDKIKMKWGMDARRCVLQATQQMESIIENESSQMGIDMTKRCFVGSVDTPPKEYCVSSGPEGPGKGSFGKILRMIFTKCFLHYVFGNAQLEGFCAESRKILLIIQALKDDKEPIAFDLEGMYTATNECVINNPYVLQSVVWMNDWIEVERQRALTSRGNAFSDEVME
uniref:Polymerase acidic protein n=1 Tax=Salamander influenza-like virus TaxID=2777034 RepID=A0A866W054_9ORTO|nr:polymerase acidic protein [Salamander influenza-like virus]